MRLEPMVRALTVVTFALLCWVVHRSVQPRSNCVNSPYVALVQIGEQKIFNCRFESRLSLEPLFHPLGFQSVKRLEAIESVNQLVTLWPARRPRLNVEVVESSAEFFEIGKNYVRLGTSWFEKPEQLHRALIMGAVNSELNTELPSLFELEVIADFLSLALSNSDDAHQTAMRSLKFSTSSPGFATYCKSPFRSLIHERACKSSELGSDDLMGRVWGYRPLLAAALWRVFDKVSLHEKLLALRKLRGRVDLPVLRAPFEGDSATLALWFTEALREHLSALGLNQNVMALKRTLKELEVEAPTHWELTVDVTKTPAWRDILEQLKTRARFKPKERTLVFTPEGLVALPSGLPVNWAVSDISSQKHVRIACGWPAPDEFSGLRARHVYSEESCAKLTRPFWD